MLFIFSFVSKVRPESQHEVDRESGNLRCKEIHLDLLHTQTLLYPGISRHTHAGGGIEHDPDPDPDPDPISDVPYPGESISHAGVAIVINQTQSNPLTDPMCNTMVRI